MIRYFLQVLVVTSGITILDICDLNQGIRNHSLKYLIVSNYFPTIIFRLLAMRKKLGLYANLRPAKVIPQLIDASTLKKEVIEGVDIMVVSTERLLSIRAIPLHDFPRQVRELTGGIYFGTPKGIETDSVTNSRKGYSTAVYTDTEIERITKVALDIAAKRRGKLCSVDKVS